MRHIPLTVIPQLDANLKPPEFSYLDFEATPSNDTTAIADSQYFSDRSLQFQSWISRASKIRSSHDIAFCAGNLSLALADVGAAYQVSSNGATNLLTLLPTAGALIGAPAKELWVLYKLMPLAGLLSMAFSLGGNIIPQQINDYRNLDDFSYGMRNSTSPGIDVEKDKLEKSGAEDFAKTVYTRVIEDYSGSKKTIEVATGILMLLACSAGILGACWILQSGAIVVWWCTGKNWMFLWYGTTVLSGMVENLAGVPFSRSWTIRVSRAPEGLQIDSQAPCVTALGRPQDEAKARLRHVSISSESDVTSLLPRTADRLDQPDQTSVLANLERGYNTTGQVILQGPWSASLDTIYVIISQEGVFKYHQLFRLLSKLLAVAVFTIGTALFASSALVTILVAIIAMTLVLVGGIFGRVTAMWISTVIMRDRPIIHQVVKSRDEANKYLTALLEKDDMVCEVMGHVMVNGRCIERYGYGLQWSMLLGVLAPSYDFRRIALRSAALVSQTTPAPR